MIEIGNKIVSAELILKKFCCDLLKCKGTCCVEGDSGAPLEEDETKQLSQEYDSYKDYMTKSGRDVIKKCGFSVKDEEGDLVTPLIHNRECAYSYLEDGVTKCAVEKAFLEGKSNFRKPISCYLYPLREVKFSNGTVGLQFHEWEVCEGAKTLGEKLGLPVYKMLKEPITQRYGAEFYEALQAVEQELLK